MNLFIIGAGFTKAIFPEAPLNDELLGKLRDGKSDWAIQYLKEKYPTNNIEIALTRLDADISDTADRDQKQNEKLLKIRKVVELSLAEYFNSFSVNHGLITNKPWLSKFLHSVVADGDIVVSLNYDCVFEGSLDCIGKWSPRGGYGDCLNNLLISDSDFDLSPVTVLKIHGSTSFKSAPYFNKPESRAVGFIFNKKYFPNSAKHSNFDYGLGKGETYLIAPSYIKALNVEIAYLMLDALKATSDAQRLIIAGCSLRKEDSFLWLVLTHFLRHDDWKSRRVIILDQKADNIASKIDKYWGVNVRKCIIPIEGSIEESIDNLCKIMQN